MSIHDHGHRQTAARRRRLDFDICFAGYLEGV